MWLAPVLASYPAMGQQSLHAMRMLQRVISPKSLSVLVLGEIREQFPMARASSKSAAQQILLILDPLHLRLLEEFLLLFRDRHEAIKPP